MEQQMVETALKSSGFTSLEALLMGVVGVLFWILIKVLIKDRKDNIIIMTEIKNVVANNTKAIENFPDAVSDKIQAILK